MTALGFRVKSGYAIAILVRGPASAPTVVERHIVDLSDAAIPETRQPYHSNFGEAEEDARLIARRVTIIERVAAKSVAALLAGADAKRAGLVVGSVIDPATVGNQHIRAHAHEGRLFRTVLEDALTARGVSCSVVVEKVLAETARARLKRTEAEMKQMLTAFGRTLGSPWRSDEKAAAMAAWMALQGLTRK